MPIEPAPMRPRTGCPFEDAETIEEAKAYVRRDLPPVIAGVTDPALKAYFQKILNSTL